MHSSVLNKRICLYLNKLWQPISAKTPREAIRDMAAGAALALDIQYGEKEGVVDYGDVLGIIPVSWQDWLNIPVRYYDEYISSPKLDIRAPTVLVSVNYDKMPIIRARLTKRAIFERERGLCAYTGKQLTRSNQSIDHILPKSLGGKDTWTNLVLCSKEINFKKGNRTNEQAGLKLRISPKEPNQTIAMSMISYPEHESWKLFLFNK